MQFAEEEEEEEEEEGNLENRPRSVLHCSQPLL